MCISTVLVPLGSRCCPRVCNCKFSCFLSFFFFLVKRCLVCVRVFVFLVLGVCCRESTFNISQYLQPFSLRSVLIPMFHLQGALLLKDLKGVFTPLGHHPTKCNSCCLDYFCFYNKTQLCQNDINMIWHIKHLASWRVIGSKFRGISHQRRFQKGESAPQNKFSRHHNPLQHHNYFSHHTSETTLSRDFCSCVSRK